MRRMRTRLLLGAIACLVLATPLAAQVAPSISGETGLFEVTNADMLPRDASPWACPGACGTGRRRPFPRGRAALGRPPPLRPPADRRLRRLRAPVPMGGLPEDRLQPVQRVQSRLAGRHQRPLPLRRLHAHRDGQGPPRHEDPPQPEGSGARRALRRHLRSRRSPGTTSTRSAPPARTTTSASRSTSDGSPSSRPTT